MGGGGGKRSRILERRGRECEMPLYDNYFAKGKVQRGEKHQGGCSEWSTVFGGYNSSVDLMFTIKENHLKTLV